MLLGGREAEGATDHPTTRDLLEPRLVVLLIVSENRFWGFLTIITVVLGIYLPRLCPLLPYMTAVVGLLILGGVGWAWLRR